MELDREQEQWHNITVIATQRGMSDLLPSGAQSSRAHQSNLSLKALPAVGNTKCVVKMIESLCKFFNISVSLLFFLFFFRQPKSCVKGCGCHRDTRPEWQCAGVGQAVHDVSMWLQCPRSGPFLFCFCLLFHLTSDCALVFVHSVSNSRKWLFFKAWATFCPTYRGRDQITFYLSDVWDPLESKAHLSF